MILNEENLKTSCVKSLIAIAFICCSERLGGDWKKVQFVKNSKVAVYFEQCKNARGSIACTLQRPCPHIVSILQSFDMFKPMQVVGPGRSVHCAIVLRMYVCTRSVVQAAIHSPVAYREVRVLTLKLMPKGKKKEITRPL